MMDVWPMGERDDDPQEVVIARNTAFRWGAAAGFVAGVAAACAVYALLALVASLLAGVLA